MQVVAVTDPLELGFARQAMVGIRVTGPLEPVADALAELDEVDYVVITAGTYDLLAEVVAESDDHLLAADLRQDPHHRGRDRHGDVHVPQAAQADLLVGCSLSPSLWADTAPPAAPRPPLAGDLDVDVADRRRGLHRPVDRLLPRRGRPVAADRGARGRDRRLRRERAQRRLVLGAVPGLAVVPGRAGRPRVRARPARRDARPRSTRWAGCSPPRASTPTGPRAGRSPWPAPPPSWPGPGRRSTEARSWGRAEDDVRLLDADAARGVLAATEVLGATYTPDCAAIHPLRLVRGLADAVVARGVRLHEHTRVDVDRARPRDHRARRGPGRDRDPGDRGLHRRPCAGHRRRLAPVYSLVIATEPLPDDVWDQIGLRRRETFSDHRHLIIYGQRTADDRMVFGGRGAPYHFGSRIRPGYDRDDRVFAQAAGDPGRALPGARRTPGSRTPGAARWAWRGTGARRSGWTR